MTAPDHEADARALWAHLSLGNIATPGNAGEVTKELAAFAERAFAAGRRAGVDASMAIAETWMMEARRRDLSGGYTANRIADDIRALLTDGDKEGT